jgi:hypothetical protein
MNPVYQHEYYLANREKIRKRRRKWYIANCEKV